MEYKIVLEQYKTSFENKVNELIKQGWLPQGGVSVAPDTETSHACFAQAMIRDIG